MDDCTDLDMLYDAIREVAGDAGILSLQKALGGSEVWVANRRMTERSALVRAFGWETASAINDKLKVIGADGHVAGGVDVYIPIGPFSLLNLAKSEARAALKQGLSAREAAGHAGLSERTCYRLRRELGFDAPSRSRLARSTAISALEQGLSTREAARLAGRSIEWCRGLRRELGLGAEKPQSVQSTRRFPKSDLVSRDERAATLIAEHVEGYQPAEIARRHGWTVGYVHCLFCRLRRETGLALRFDRRPSLAARWDAHVAERSAKVEAAFEMGVSTPGIAARLGISVSSVRNYLAKARRTSGKPFRFDLSALNANACRARERRRAIVEAYRPGMVLDELGASTGLDAREVQRHLVRIRRETGQPFPIARRAPPVSRCGSPDRNPAPLPPPVNPL